MKQLHKYLLSTILVVIFVAGCDTDSLHNLNNSPQFVNELNLNFLFTSAQLGSASGGAAGDNRYIDWRTNIGMCSYAIQQLANAGGGIAPGDKYTDNAETSSAPFEFIYGDELNNLAAILRQSGPGGYAEGKYLNLRQAARIVRAQLFHRLTDYYGSVPYSEALQGVDKIFYPKYDKQKAIYADLLKELDEATAALSDGNADEGFGAADLYYDGDIDKWKKFGYSLMLRLAMRISNVDQATAETYIAKAVAGGGFESNDDNVWVPMALAPSQWVNQNGISRAFYPGDGGQPTFLSKTFIDWLKGANPNDVSDDDPRLMIICGGIGDWNPPKWEPTVSDPLKQKGMPNGYDAPGLQVYEGAPKPVDQDATYSKINPLMLDNDESYMLMNYAEVEFLMAEAAERGLGGLSAGAAPAHYAAGVKAAMQMFTPYDATLTVSDGEVATYLATYPYTGTQSEKLAMIGEQLWASKFLNWWEAWSDWRRTGIPALTPTNYPGNITGGTIPQRLRYPNAEVAGNPNFAAGATSPNLYTTKVWWAGGPE
ncbi:SusD/RagB family nutrient-binding outer membrane lipoprotein [Chryseolinea soli]|uniref:SusD/RagB family nutrient-binding outer membrane lipoprotein n=1 Tax=Chryseolinea soli TaxID=2321403 RepID=A0A385SRG3_9BACT|nr:SusD/RagB family nutrient-binding outer membrane lipoprotein [Chryseolinea soli]AYB34383.1 SusD/RagB family nutrient-binding outer membrane lipoprotein [Chryseolinea soli]